MHFHTVPILTTHWHGPHIFELEIQSPGFSFQPGDCVAIFAANGQASRPYSIASPPGQNSLRFVIRRMPGGEVSDYLAGLTPGSLIKISPPFGWFRPGEKAENAPFVFVATGTGISPFLSYLRAPAPLPPLQLFYGVRQQEDLVEPSFLAQRAPLFLAISRERVHNTFHGRITGMLDKMIIHPNAHYYLCGIDDMIDEVTIHLEAKGIPTRHIHRECFFNAHY